MKLIDIFINIMIWFWHIGIIVLIIMQIAWVRGKFKIKFPEDKTLPPEK